MNHFALVVTWTLPDDADQSAADAALLGIRDRIHANAPAPAENVTAYVGVSAELIDQAARAGHLADAADGDVQWGYSFVDSPTSVCGPVSELTARRKVDGDYSAVLHRRDVVDSEPGPWKAVETR